MNPKELEELKKKIAGICGKPDCLFEDGSYPCPEGDGIDGSNMCDFCKAQQIIKIAEPLIRRDERERMKTAKVICLCGSTRFTGEMLVKQWELTKQGHIVVSWCALPETYFQGEDKTHIGDQEGVKEIVDEVHKRKIDLCDEVFVLNINGYIGESTASEIAYAETIGKPVNYWQALREKGIE